MRTRFRRAKETERETERERETADPVCFHVVETYDELVEKYVVIVAAIGQPASTTCPNLT